jgi:hypothetical protein
VVGAGEIGTYASKAIGRYVPCRAEWDGAVASAKMTGFNIERCSLEIPAGAPVEL